MTDSFVYSHHSYSIYIFKYSNIILLKGLLAMAMMMMIVWWVYFCPYLLYLTKSVKSHVVIRSVDRPTNQSTNPWRYKWLAGYYHNNSPRATTAEPNTCLASGWKAPRASKRRNMWNMDFPTILLLSWLLSRPWTYPRYMHIHIEWLCVHVWWWLGWGPVKIDSHSTVLYI